MYSEPVKRRTGLLVFLIVLVLFAVMVGLVFLHSGRDISEEGATAIRETVRRSALQCYVVEGVYPPDLDYLVRNYGLAVNTEDYVVVYECFSSNLPPTVRVVARSL